MGTFYIYSPQSFLVYLPLCAKDRQNLRAKKASKMKTFQSILLLGLLFASSATAEFKVNRKSDGTIISVQEKPSRPLIKKRECARNNCVRAMIARPSSATSFCQTFTATVQTASAAVSPFRQCDKGPVQASSACSCLVPVCIPFLFIRYSLQL